MYVGYGLVVIIVFCFFMLLHGLLVTWAGWLVFLVWFGGVVVVCVAALFLFCVGVDCLVVGFGVLGVVWVFVGLVGCWYCVYGDALIVITVCCVWWVCLCCWNVWLVCGFWFVLVLWLI